VRRNEKLENWNHVMGRKKSPTVGGWRIKSMSEWDQKLLAVVNRKTIDGMICIYQGDKSGFTAKKAKK